MTMDPEKLQRIERMGLGPVWQLRSRAETPMGNDADVFELPAGSITTDHDISVLDWDALESSIRECTRCNLCHGRTHAVPGIGDRNASWLFVGEGPGHNEDIQGEPFVGSAGKLLDNMLKAMQLTRGTDTYIANIVNCRAVDADGRDRPPSVAEAAACRPYIQRQIDLIKPSVIIALGKTAATPLLGLSENTALGTLRGAAHAFRDIPVVVTYHPAYLLRKPEDKAKSWQDLCLARRLHNER